MMNIKGYEVKAYAFWDASSIRRTGTILTAGPDMLRGNVVMKNPGSAAPLGPDLLRDDGRLLFSVDATMHAIADLFLLRDKGGTVRIFNLSDDRNPDYASVRSQLTLSEDDTASQISGQDVPTYIGWGDMYREPLFSGKARSIFEAARLHTEGYNPDIASNPFFHPLYLMRYGRRKPECASVINSFRMNLKYK